MAKPADTGLEVASGWIGSDGEGRDIAAVKGSLTETRDAGRDVSPHEEAPAVTDELLEARDQGRR